MLNFLTRQLPLFGLLLTVVSTAQTPKVESTVASDLSKSFELNTVSFAASDSPALAAAKRKQERYFGGLYSCLL
jgi:hypothetical protein